MQPSDLPSTRSRPRRTKISLFRPLFITQFIEHGGWGDSIKRVGRLSLTGLTTYICPLKMLTCCCSNTAREELARRVLREVAISSESQRW